MVAPLSSVAVIGYRVLLISVDLPEPDTPVTQVIRPTGISRLTLCKLLPQAPLRRSHLSFCGGLRLAGMGILTLPERYLPVSEAGLFMTSSAVP